MIKKEIQELNRVTIRLSGDSGDGIQLTGDRFTENTALAGYDLITLPDYPAEIRAPAGTLFGVSGFQIQFSKDDVYTPGDQPDLLIAFNPAALKVNLSQLKDNGIIIANSDAFDEKSLKLAGYTTNPLTDGSLEGYQLFSIPITEYTRNALEDVELTLKEKDRCKNFFALGIVFWMFGRTPDNTLEWIRKKFKQKPTLVEANSKALNAGYGYALSTELITTSFRVEKAKMKPGKYRKITGNAALALGLVAAAQQAGKSLFLGSYPITPASEILHELAKYRNYNVKTFQAEDEIAGIGSALGAAFAGAVGITTTSGPGVALKSEFMGLAVMTELPLVIINIQRGGPSTGLPTKTEQSDLLQAMYGRNGEAPIPVIAANSPADCFQAAFESVQVAFKYTTPVILLSDGYIANGAEPWLIPKAEDLPEIETHFAEDAQAYAPYKRDPESLARLMALPGTAGFEHHIGGLEKNEAGNVSYDPENHDHMVRLRDKKIKNVADFVEEPEIYGKPEGELLVLSWGSTYGSIYSAMQRLHAEKTDVSWYHLRWINPLPKNLGKYIRNFEKILIPEINLGQLLKIIRAEYLVDARGFNLVRGLPLTANSIYDKIKSELRRSL